MESVKEKIISNRQEKIKVLTLVPPSWTIKDSSSYFGVPESIIKKARKLKSEKGLLAEPNKKLGKKISEDMVKCFIDSSSGVHSVCVCEIHQNAKLLHAAITGKTDYKKFLSKFVCNTSNQDCMLCSFDSCPNLMK